MLGGSPNWWGSGLGLINPGLGALGAFVGIQAGIHGTAAYPDQINLLQSMDAKIPGGLQGMQFATSSFSADPNGTGSPTTILNGIEVTDPATGTVKGYLRYSNEGTLTFYSSTNGQPMYETLSSGGIVFTVDVSASNSGATTNTFTCTITDPSAISSTGAADPTTAVNSDTSTLLRTGVYTVNGVGNVNTAAGNYAMANNTLTDLFRPGAQSLADEILGGSLAQNFIAAPNLVNSPVWAPDVKAAALNTLGSGVLNTVPTDPLVLDLNGDGVRLTSFADAPVLFDVDHDGAKELTGWVSAQDGIVACDLNGNSKIDGISETLSEYFNGAAGAGGNAGTKPFANGFAARAANEAVFEMRRVG